MRPQGLTSGTDQLGPWPAGIRADCSGSLRHSRSGPVLSQGRTQRLICAFASHQLWPSYGGSPPLSGRCWHMLEWAEGRVSALFLEVERDRNSSTPELNPHVDKGDKPSLFQLLTGRANPCVQERAREVASPCLRRGERILGLFLGAMSSSPC